MQRTQPNYAAADLAEIHVPVTIAQGEHEEFIKREHAEYLARAIPNAKLVLLPNVSHFAPFAAARGVQSRGAGILSGSYGRGERTTSPATATRLATTASRTDHPDLVERVARGIA